MPSYDTHGLSIEEIHLMDQIEAAVQDTSLTAEQSMKIVGEILERHQG